MHKSQAERIKLADTLYANRSDIENVRLSAEFLKDYAADSYEAGWRVGRAQFFLGQEAETESESRLHYGQGIRASARAVKLSALSVEGNFWLGVNLALMAQAKRGLRSLFLVWLAKRSLGRAVRIDPGYHGAGPLRVLGRIQHKLPRVFGGSLERARSNYERALTLAPENSVTRLYFAELLMERGDTQSARRQLEAILNAAPDPAWVFELSRDRKLAEERLEKIRT